MPDGDFNPPGRAIDRPEEYKQSTMSMEDRLQPRRQRMMHIPFLLFLQAVLIVLFGFFVEYDSPAEPEIQTGTTQTGVGNSSDAGKKTTEGANGHHRTNDDVNTLGHYYPSKSLTKIASYVTFCVNI